VRMISSVISWKFWVTLIVTPTLLVGCSGLIIDFDSKFVSDEFVTRDNITVGDITLSYLRAGNPTGQRVIFLHGTPGDAGGNWYQMLKNVPEEYEFLAIDRPGFGLTKPRSPVTTLKAQVAAFEPLLITRSGKGTILVGHSFGGPVVAAAAAIHPERVAGIVVAAGALDPDLEDVLFIQHIGTIPPFSWLLDKTLRNSNKELIALEKELRLLQPKLATIKQPVVVVHGTDDKLVPYQNVAFMEDEITNSTHFEVIKIGGMNHFLQWRSNPEILAAVKKIVDALDRPTTTTNLQTAP